mgnify:CR=1 FL=1|tara:strand:+ start:26021 stop:26923 length:903 start_codon:yes stop_codon:yes gene_type:complete
MGNFISGVFSWLGDNVMDEVIDTTVRAGITTLVNGDSFKDNFKDQAILTAADAAYGAFRNRPPPTGNTPVQIPANNTNPQTVTQNASTAGNPNPLRKPGDASGTNPLSKRSDVFTGEVMDPTYSGIGSIVNKSTEVVEPPAPKPDSRGFFESMGDVVGGDPDYSRWESAKQAFLPDSEGEPDAFRKYGPMVGVGLLGAYMGGAFDPEELDVAPNRPYSQGKQNVFNRPGMYRPGVPRVSGRAQGGHVNGPGTGTSDDIPAYLSDGEFVMTNAAVAGAGGGDRQKGMQTMYNIMHDFERRA